jgi:hypothetical protein
MNQLDGRVEAGAAGAYLSQSLSLGDMKQALRRSRVFFLLAVAACELLAVLYLMVSEPRYPTEMLLAPQQQSGESSGSGALSALGGAAGLLGIKGGGVNTDFEKFRVLYLSSQTAADVDRRFHLLQRSFPGWNARAHAWQMPPWSSGNVLPRFVRWIFRRPVWRVPSAADLAETLANQITVVKSDTDPFLTVSTTSTDPKFSEVLLVALTDSANEILRQRAQEQAAAQIEYLNRQLGTVSNTEHRQVLTELLLAQEQTLMLSRSNLPYAAQILTPPTTHYNQIKPGLTLTLAIGAFLGLVVGVFIAFSREALAHSRNEVPRDSAEVVRDWIIRDR